MAAFLKSLSRLLSASKATPAVYLAAFGKHPGWNDHIDDLGLDTDALVNAKRLLYIQGISQNIDAGAWEALDPATRLDYFRHDFLWHVPAPNAHCLLAGRLWSSVDGKGRAKYPMVLCAQATELPDRFATQTALPFLAQVHQRCAAATSATQVRAILDAQRDDLRALMKSPLTVDALTPAQLVAAARHPDMHPPVPAPSSIAPTSAAPDPTAEAANPAALPPETAPATPATPASPPPAPSAPPAPPSDTVGEGFHRIVYQFIRGMAAYRPGAQKSATRRPEQVRLPTCGMPASEALLFWLRFALTLLDPITPILLLAPEHADSDAQVQEVQALWVDFIVGDPTSANLFCIKAGTRSLPLTSEIPYTLDPSLTMAINNHIAACASLPPNSPLPPWPSFQ